MKAFDECGDCLIVGYFQDLKAHFREMGDVVSKRLILIVMYPLVVILVARLFAGGYEIIDETLA
jgi:hypothetical protein